MSASHALEVLGEDLFATMMSADPVHAHILGAYDYAGAWADVSRDAEDARLAELADLRRRAGQIDATWLTDAERVTLEVLISEVERTAELVSIRMPRYGADPIMGAQVDAARVVSMLSLPDQRVADRVIDTVRSLGGHFATLATRQREGLATGQVGTRRAAIDTLAQIDSWLATPLAADPLLAAVAAETGRGGTEWFDRLTEAVRTDLRAGLVSYRRVLREEVIPEARDDDHPGLCWLDGGAELHAKALHSYTTTTATAEQVHQRGLEQLEHLHDEYQRLGAEVFATTDVATVWSRLRTEPELRIRDAAELTGIAQRAMDRAFAAMPAWFELTPDAPCRVREQVGGLKAQFLHSAGDGSRGGTVYFNVADPSAWGRFEVESTTFHESVPGHHLQFTVAARQDELPRFRRHIYVHSYSEGWGLYSELLADEMGLYTGAIDRLGMLAADSMRACRMVVDTGIHALGWSRHRAIDFMLDNSPLSRGVVAPEIDRYIIDPGQSPSYMLGRLEIERMRREATTREGADFDLRRFHTAVLAAGSVPMDTLDRIIRTRLPGA